MSNSKISALTSATTPLAGTETLPVVQSGTTKQVTVANLTAGRAVSTGALSVVGANATIDNAYYLNGKLAAGSAVAMIGRNSSDVVVIDPDGYGAKIGFGGRYSFAGGGDFTNVLGNYIQGTAAKGINFTANTPAAGMTSQLLNWYEEGSYTPTVAATTGSITSYTASAGYTRIGRQVTMVANVTITNAGTGTGTLTITLPFTANGSFAFNGAGRENALTGYMLQGSISAGGTVVNVVSYTNATAIATSAQIRMTITYFV
jgi:hypothetical protein